MESVCSFLIEHGYLATRYHAGLEEQERSENQEDFLYDRKTVMVATNAFGMGIDKSNVGYVIHYNMPKSMEAYYQEAGRAGRDGSEAECILLYSRGDVATARFFIENNGENEELSEEQREVIRLQDYARLEAMTGYCKTKDCLRGYILDYFGQKHPQICGNCGSCKGEYENRDITRESQMILSCIKRIYDRLGYCVGQTTLVRTLQGSRDKLVTENGLQTLSTYGLLKRVGVTKIAAMIDQLEADGYLQTDTQTLTLKLLPKAGDVLYRGKSVQMKVRKSQEKPERGDALSDRQSNLLDELKELRSVLARENGIPAYVIFSNATLLDMAKKAPKNMTEFRRISGVGEIKAAWYGKAFLECIRSFREENE